MKHSKKRKRKVKSVTVESRIEKICIHLSHTLHVALAYSILHAVVILIEEVKHVA